MTSLETAKLAAKALDSKKGLDIKIIRIEDISSMMHPHFSAECVLRC